MARADLTGVAWRRGDIFAIPFPTLVFVNAWILIDSRHDKTRQVLNQTPRDLSSTMDCRGALLYVILSEAKNLYDYLRDPSLALRVTI